MNMVAPNSNVLNRTLWIRCGAKSGTAFTVEVDDHQFLVTAAHILEDLGSGAPLQRMVGGRWVALAASSIPADPDFVDVAILCPERQLTSAPPVTLGLGGFVLGQDMMILGYPFDVSAFSGEPTPFLMANGSPLPMVKKGAFAWMEKAPGPGHTSLYLDCYANQGFSGGPVVGFPGSSDRISIAGVVSHYVPERKPVLESNGQRTALTAEQNPGILVAYDIAHATDGIHAAGVDRGPRVSVISM